MNAVERVKNILLQPRQEWPVIEQEAITGAELYQRYVMQLAAISPLASLIGWSVVGMTVPSAGTVRMPLLSSIPYTIVLYGMTLGWVYLYAWIISFLAPSFGGVANRMQALKVAAYAATAAFIGGVFNLIPAMAVFAFFAGCYSLYVMYLGLPVLMKVPVERTLAYTAAIVIAGILIGCLLLVPIALLSSLITPSMEGGFKADASVEDDAEQLVDEMLKRMHTELSKAKDSSGVQGAGHAMEGLKEGLSKNMTPEDAPSMR